MSETGETVVIRRCDLPSMFDVLIASGYVPVGPTVQDGAIVIDEITSIDDLPEGWSEDQDAGTYSLKKRGDQALFGFNNGPHSWKRYLFPPRTKLWEGDRMAEGGFSIREHADSAKPFAFIGVRSCDLHAIEVQDRVFIDAENTDPVYAARRRNAFVVVVNCGQAAKTCFCTSMSTGPRARSGFDLALTEVVADGEHYFVAEAGSARGHDLLSNIPHTQAKGRHLAAAEACSQRAVAQMGRSLETVDIKSLLYRNYENKRWDDIEKRCLSCANCTMVCPTCFCSKVEDTTDLSGDHAERWREWDSCFTMDFSYIHGGSVRTKTRSRYRQWMVHKLATWIDQFGSSGCVGCGRCITWCPVGIDLTEEVRLIRESETEKEQAHG